MHFFVAPWEFCDIFFRLLACNCFTTSICLTRVILLPTVQKVHHYKGNPSNMAIQAIHFSFVWSTQKRSEFSMMPLWLQPTLRWNSPETTQYIFYLSGNDTPVTGREAHLGSSMDSSSGAPSVNKSMTWIRQLWKPMAGFSNFGYPFPKFQGVFTVIHRWLFVEGHHKKGLMYVNEFISTTSLEIHGWNLHSSPRAYTTWIVDGATPMHWYVYHGPSLSHLLGVAPSTFTRVYINSNIILTSGRHRMKM